jgi:hypothetical protein
LKIEPSLMAARNDTAFTSMPYPPRVRSESALAITEVRASALTADAHWRLRCRRRCGRGPRPPRIVTVTILGILAIRNILSHNGSASCSSRIHGFALLRNERSHHRRGLAEGGCTDGADGFVERGDRKPLHEFR